jgi:peptide/nickel transport system ATP-binding protein
MSLLEVRALSVDLGAASVLRDVSFSVAAGQTVGLVGESGSGKSMTALAILGLLPDAATARGEIRFQGERLDEARLARLRGGRIGMVFQEPMTALDPRQRIDDAVGESLRLHRGLSRRAARAEAAALLAAVGLAPPRVAPGQYPHRLSGGQRQRALLASAIACGPDLLLADEPTTALDAVHQARALDLLRRLATSRGMAMLLISHDLRVVRRQTERVIVMYAGGVVEAGTSAAVFTRLSHPYSRALLAASPHVASGRPVPIPGAPPDPRHRPPGCAFAPRCPRASARCQEAPPLTGTEEHAVACWHQL